jgi:hypothetical protein
MLSSSEVDADKIINAGKDRQSWGQITNSPNTPIGGPAEELSPEIALLTDQRRAAVVWGVKLSCWSTSLG